MRIYENPDYTSTNYPYPVDQPYVVLQEHGNHNGVKMEFTSGQDFECNVSDYTTLKAAHTDELVQDGKVHLRVDYTGIGSNSCGPALARKYRLDEKGIFFCFSMKPV